MTEGAPDAVAAATSVPDAIETAGDLSRDEAGLRIRGIRKWYGDTRALDGLDIDERQTQVLGLTPGNYVLYCNLEGHYLGGMHASLAVR